MNRKITLIALLSTSVFGIAQNDNSQNIDLAPIKSAIQKQQREIEGINRKLNEYSYQVKVNRDSIEILSGLVQNNKNNISILANDLGTKIQESEQQSESRISELGGDVEKNRLYWIIASLIMLLLGILMYLITGKRIKSSQTDVETQIKNTKKSLEEESLKLDGELVKVFQKQLEVMEIAPKEVTQEEDHSLVLKIADRLTAMETNHYRMDPNTRGLKQLKNAVKSIKENYLANGYEIVEMLELEYKEGMNVTANFIPSDKIEKGKRLITRIIKPQVNFNGKMIQAAEIEVSVGE